MEGMTFALQTAMPGKGTACIASACRRVAQKASASSVAEQHRHCSTCPRQWPVARQACTWLMPPQCPKKRLQFMAQCDGACAVPVLALRSSYRDAASCESTGMPVAAVKSIATRVRAARSIKIPPSPACDHRVFHPENTAFLTRYDVGVQVWLAASLNGKL